MWSAGMVYGRRPARPTPESMPSKGLSCATGALGPSPTVSARRTVSGIARTRAAAARTAAGAAGDASRREACPLSRQSSQPGRDPDAEKTHSRSWKITATGFVGASRSRMTAAGWTRLPDTSAMRSFAPGRRLRSGHHQTLGPSEVEELGRLGGVRGGRPPQGSPSAGASGADSPGPG